MLETFLVEKDSLGNIKRRFVNPSTLYVRPYVLLPDPPNEAITVAASSISSPVVMTGPQDGPFEGFMVTAYATSTAYMVYDLEHRRRKLLSGPIHSETMLGGQIFPAGLASLGISPYYLPETIWLMPHETLVWQFQDLSASPNVVKIALIGRIFCVGTAAETQKLLDAKSKEARYNNQVSAPFWYTTNEQPFVLTAGQTRNTTVQVAADGAFQLFKVSCRSDYTFTLRIFDPVSGRRLTSGPVHSNLLATNTAQFPFIFPEPLLVKRNAWIQLELVNLNAAQTNNIYLTFAGRRIYTGDENL